MFLFVFLQKFVEKHKILDPQNTTSKNHQPKKQPRGKNLDSRNTHEKIFRTNEGTMARWHETHGI